MSQVSKNKRKKLMQDAIALVNDLEKEAAEVRYRIAIAHELTYRLFTKKSLQHFPDMPDSIKHIESQINEIVELEKK